MSKRLSVVMPNYNYGKYIGEALEAILTQSVSPDEVIVVDDASTDNSINIIKMLMREFPKMRLIQNENNMGVIYSMNRGLKAASGEYIYGAASDDKVLPGFFEKSMQLLLKYPEAGLCCSDEIIYDGHKYVNNKYYLSNTGDYISPAEVVKLYLQESFTPLAARTVIIKHSALDEAGGYIQDLKWYCDAFADNVVCFRYGFCYLPEPLVVYRQHPNQYGRQMIKKWDMEREIIEKTIKLIKMPEYRDVFPIFKKTAALSSFQWEILRVVISKRAYWGFLSFKLVRHAIYDKIIKRTLLNAMPKTLMYKLRDIIGMTRKLKSIIRKYQGKSNN